MKKRSILPIMLFMFLIGINYVKADNCEPQALKQLAKIVYMEIGGTAASNKEDTFFMRLTTASVVLNNASKKSGNNWYEKIYNLPNNTYANYSTYKDKQFADLVPNYKKGEMLYIASLVLNGKYNIPKNIIGQASCACTLGKENCSGIDVGLEAYNCTAAGWAKEWTHVDTGKSDFDTYFGYSMYDNSISDKDVFGKTVQSTEPSHYKKLAKILELNDYSKITVDNACETQANSNNNNKNDDNSGATNNENSAAFDTCTNPDILKVIYFLTLLINIVKIIIPIGLIVMGMIDFSKSVVTSDEGVQKKNLNLFIKRIIYAVLIFIMPWIVKVLIVSLGNLTKDVNYTDCLENANSEKIQELESEQENSTSNNSSNNNGTNTKNYDYVVYIGDSRTVGMCNAVTLNSKEDCSISAIGTDYNWLKSNDVKDRLENIIAEHPNSYIVINMGTNSSLTEKDGSSYAMLYNSLANKYTNCKVVAISVTQVDRTLAKQNGMYSGVDLTDNSVATFNKGLINSMDRKVSYCDIYSKMQNYDYKASDGVHYDSETYKFIYEQIQDCLNK